MVTRVRHLLDHRKTKRHLKGLGLDVREVGLRKHCPRPPTLQTLGLHTASVSRENPSPHEH
jgi:hypothetical protein